MLCFPLSGPEFLLPPCPDLEVEEQYSICSTSNIIVYCAVKPPERKPSQEEEEIDDDEDNALKVCM